MSNFSQPDALAAELRRERSIRRTVKLLEAKREQIREDLKQLINHFSLLVPSQQPNTDTQMLQDAVTRLGDEIFAQLLMQILQEKG
ncbi:hypothetical protein [Gloeocapsa sp. PCC 73106]|uniref:hypothetical protein n=1 Tax=Gloeocapsa sp. PCC 73106 TaxID=102232 RepID=UPI0002ABA756|nr:hypothetical protein [Gloeocapsa sp. PCC 73106]ELR99398.1 hypothetical protein GLO73106DRAFT_00032490 [Gloeocapsa sp. PCC 73106]